MKKAIMYGVTLIFLFTSISCGPSSLSDYKPKNQAEQEIKSLRIEYMACRNRHDLEGVLALFHDDAKITIDEPGMVALKQPSITKEQSRKAWAQLFESFPRIIFTNPEMEVTGNEAVVNFRMGVIGVEMGCCQHLVKENDRWLITEFTAL
ncbi:MAG: nuclear transport factor 2 family protein [Deltaproteobacteria bacterium]|nr:nuclear transport factor 2 family protein [Deltaproteobacteria bacterium]